MMLVLLSEGYVAVGGVAMARPWAQAALAVAQERRPGGVRGCDTPRSLYERFPSKAAGW
jgi:hypothetical protein